MRGQCRRQCIGVQATELVSVDDEDVAVQHAGHHPDGRVRLLSAGNGEPLTRVAGVL